MGWKSYGHDHDYCAVTSTVEVSVSCDFDALNALKSFAERQIPVRNFFET